MPQHNLPLQMRLLETPINPGFREAVINKLWGTPQLHHTYSVASDSPYFHHVYQELCENACREDQDTQLATQVSHEDVLNLVIMLMDPAVQPGPVLESLGGRTPRAERCLRLAAGLLLPLNFEGIGGRQSGKSILWDLETPLGDIVSSQFPSLLPRTTFLENATCLTCGDPMLLGPRDAAHQIKNEGLDTMTWTFPRSFSAYKLAHIAGFEIVWTSNLLDHLRIDDANEKIRVHVFHQIKLLDRLGALQVPILPHALVEETKQTLALLLPKGDKRTRKWFFKLQKKSQLDPDAIRCESLESSAFSTEHYRYWRRRLVELKDAYDGHQPRSPLQVWRDDRHIVQWWTFWIAALVLFLTILFGLVQSITGILQVSGVR